MLEPAAVADPAPVRVALRVKKHARTARQVREHTGVGGVAFLVARRALRLVGIRTERFRVLEQRPETAAIPGRDPIAPTWVPGAADPGMLTTFGRSPELVRRRLAAGDSAAVVTDAQGLVAQLWVHPGGVYDEEGVLFRLAWTRPGSSTAWWPSRAGASASTPASPWGWRGTSSRAGIVRLLFDDRRGQRALAAGGRGPRVRGARILLL